MQIALFFTLLVLVVLIPLVPIWLFHKLRNSRFAHLAWIALALMIPMAIFFSYLTVVSFGGAFGPGAFLQCLTIPLAIGGLLYHLSLERSAEKAKAHLPYRQWWVRALVILLILAYLLSPLLGFAVITGYCYQQNAAIAQPIITALENYRESNGQYPEALEALVPNYLATIPQPTCLDLSSSSYVHSYTLEHCSRYGSEAEEDVVLWLDVVQGGFPQRYHFNTHKWSSISFLDGVCSFLD